MRQTALQTQEDDNHADEHHDRALMVQGALETAERLGTSATLAGISGPAPYVQGFADLFGGEG